MKRFLLLLLCLLLLTGCQAAPQTPSVPEIEPATTAETIPPTEQSGVPLLDLGIAVGESGNLWYIPNDSVESMACPEIRLYGNSLLLYEHTFQGLLLRRISLEDGSLLAEASYDLTPSARLQVGNGCIGISDSGSGQVLILGDSLEQQHHYSVPMEGENWCLNQEMETLYVFFSEKGLQTRDLATGETRWMLENAALVQPLGVGSGYVLFSYTDRGDQRTYNRCLNLSTATLETFPVDGAVSAGIRTGEQWLLRRDFASGEYILADQDTAKSFVWPEGNVQLLSGKRQLVMTDDSYRTLYLYDLSGSFLSQCDLTEMDYASVGTDLVWSGYWQGYFFRDTYDNEAHLMFWDTSVSQEGTKLNMVSLSETQPSVPVMDQGLYQRVTEISQRFGIDIRIGEQCALDYTHYEGQVLTDPYYVGKSLDALETALSVYPQGFFLQLPYGSMRQIRIELVVGLRSKEDVDTHPTLINGFAQAGFDHYLIVLDGFSLEESTIYHELSHVIDKRLEWDAALRSDALYSEETWLSLQPKGFRYAESYTDIPAAVMAFEDSGYFVRSYSLTFPTEDRATLMALVMSDATALEGKPGMAAKMRYYAACIRDCFNTDGWPERTCWEPKENN